MMTHVVKPQSFPDLKRAYHYIRVGDFERAGRIIARTLKDDPQNVDGWWLAAFVTPNIERKRAALLQVLALQPDHLYARSMLQKLGVPKAKKTATLEIPTESGSRKKRKIKWFYVVMMTIGILGSMSVSMLLLDNFTGGDISSRLERLIFGEPDALGWVDVADGGATSESVDRGERIPIVKRVPADIGGVPIVDILDKGEAHEYTLNARRGDELIIAVAFSHDENPNVIALEFWDQQGHLLEHEILDLPFEIPFLSGRAMTYNIIRNGNYSIIVVGRDGGPSGNYTMSITTLDDVAESYEIDH